MSTKINLSDGTANAEANALAALMNSGFIEIFSGTQPVNANTALSGNTLLATFTFASTAFPSAVAGVITANAIANVTAVATGTAAFGRIYKSDGTTVVMDCSAGTSGNVITLNTTSIVSGAIISVTSCAFTVTE